MISESGATRGEALEKVSRTWVAQMTRAQPDALRLDCRDQHAASHSRDLKLGAKAAPSLPGQTRTNKLEVVSTSSNAEACDAPFDFVIVGSGFGGSVSAMRLAQKGYRVAVVEAGKRWQAADFPKTNWNAFKYLWAPRLGCFGIQNITLLKGVMVLHGSGVGGGSLVYANTLMRPKASVFDDPAWSRTVRLGRRARATLRNRTPHARRHREPSADGG